MQSTTKTHWKALSNPDHIGAYAFQPGEEKTVTIDRVGLERVVGADGKAEDLRVIRFRENVKPMIANETNSKMIAKLLKTPYIDEWTGRKIVLGVEQVKAFGEVVDAVRVKNKLPKQAPAAQIPCEDCGQIIATEGKFTPEQIVSAAKQQYGKALCFACATKRKEASGADA